MKREDVIEGVVTLPDGQPAVGAEVTVAPHYQPRGVPPRRGLGLTQGADGSWRWVLDQVASQRHEVATAVTDEKGAFAITIRDGLAEVAARDRLALWAEKDALVARRALVRLQPELAPVRLSLAQAVTPVVTLVDPDGAPVDGAEAELWLSVENEFGDSIPEWSYWLGGRSDATGRVTFPRAPEHPEWTAWLVVNAPGRARLRESDIDAEDYFRQSARVVIPRGVQVRGRVQRSSSDARGPILVWSFRRDEDPCPNSGHQAFAAVDGAFVLDDVPSVDASVVVEELPEPGPPEEVEERRALFGKKIINIEGALLKAVDLGTVLISPPLSISGRVELADGRPPASGWVTSDTPGPSFSIAPDGSFRVAGLEPGMHRLTFWVVEHEGPGGNPLVDTIEAEEELEAGATGVVVRVHGGGNVIVRFHPKGQSSEPLEVWSPSLARGHCGGGTAGKSSQIRMSFSPGSRSDLRVEAEGYKTHMLGAVEILPDRPTVIDVELEPEEPSTSGR